MYASFSSVYGGNKKAPFCTEDKVDNPVSLYAATKKSTEQLAYSYSKLYNLLLHRLAVFNDLRVGWVVGGVLFLRDAETGAGRNHSDLQLWKLQA